MNTLCVKLFITAALVIVLSGCANQLEGEVKKQPDIQQEPVKTTLSVEDFFVYGNNVKYVFEGQGNEYASYSTWVDFNTGDRVQLRTDNGGTQSVRVIEKKNGALTMLLFRGEIYYREDFTKTENTNPEVLLKEPIEVGNRWTLPNGKNRSITNLTANITTPMGNYQAVEVVTEGNGQLDYSYYAAGVGLVKTVYGTKDAEVSSTLSEVVQNSDLIQNIKFYYPNNTANGLNVATRPVRFRTNDMTNKVLEDETRTLIALRYETQPDTATRINSLYLNTNNNTVYVDFSKALTENMKVGSGFESMILQSIVNTLGRYYGVDKVCITIDGDPYQSGHYLMNKDEPFTTDYKNVTED